MGFKMQESDLEYAEKLCREKETCEGFFRVLEESANFFEALRHMMGVYREHIESRHMESRTPSSLREALEEEFIRCATFILAGLYSVNGKKVPYIPPSLIGDVRDDGHDCQELPLESHDLLGSFGIVNEEWVSEFAQIMCMQLFCPATGMKLIYTVATAWIEAGRVHDLKEQTEALRSTGVLDQLEEILEAKNF